jgi:hypothetical protein
MTWTAWWERVTDGGAWSMKKRRGRNIKKEKKNPRIATKGDGTSFNCVDEITRSRSLIMKMRGDTLIESMSFSIGARGQVEVTRVLRPQRNDDDDILAWCCVTSTTNSD